VLPLILVELIIGAGIASAGAAILLVTQASMAHANIRLNSRGFGWLFPTNTYHVRHHSANFAESNTDYRCAAMVGDRVFRTFMDTGILAAGIGPVEPST